MLPRLFLGLQAILFIPYGLYCLVNPDFLAGSAGVVATTLTGTIELQAMYGGLQSAVGLLCLLGAVQLAYQRTALVMLLFVFTGLAIPRVTLALINGSFSEYTVFAITLEVISSLMALWLMMKGDATRTTSP